MAGDVRKVYVGSPAFTCEDDDRYYYVDTEVDGLMTQDDELLINDAALVSVSHNQYQPRQDSILRDSLEDDFSDSNKDSIVVANPSRYEDLTLRGASHQVSRRGIVAKSVERRLQCLHDDMDEYEEAKLERQHQQLEARRAHCLLYTSDAADE